MRSWPYIAIGLLCGVWIWKADLQPTVEYWGMKGSHDLHVAAGIGFTALIAAMFSATSWKTRGMTRPHIFVMGGTPFVLLNGIEYMQHWIPGRTVELADAVANTTGILIALAIVWAYESWNAAA